MSVGKSKNSHYSWKSQRYLFRSVFLFQSSCKTINIIQTLKCAKCFGQPDQCHAKWPVGCSTCTYFFPLFFTSFCLLLPTSLRWQPVDILRQGSDEVRFFHVSAKKKLQKMAHFHFNLSKKYIYSICSCVCLLGVPSRM